MLRPFQEDRSIPTRPYPELCTWTAVWLGVFCVSLRTREILRNFPHATSPIGFVPDACHVPPSFLPLPNPTGPWLSTHTRPLWLTHPPSTRIHSASYVILRRLLWLNDNDNNNNINNNGCTDGLGEFLRLLNAWKVRFCLPQFKQHQSLLVAGSIKEGTGLQGGRSVDTLPLRVQTSPLPSRICDRQYRALCQSDGASISRPGDGRSSFCWQRLGHSLLFAFSTLAP